MNNKERKEKTDEETMTDPIPAQCFTIEVPVFTPGTLYLVKVLDHFTAYKSDKTECFLEVVGFYVGETKYYYQFACLYYEETTSDSKFYTPEIKNLVKTAIYDFDEITYEQTLIEIRNEIGAKIIEG